MRPALQRLLLISACAAILRADSRNQSFDDFVTPLPVQRGETLIVGIVGGWERWDHPERSIRRTAIEIKRKRLARVHIETVENHKLFLGEQLIRRAFDFDRDGNLSRDEAAQAKVVIFGQSLGGRATLWLSRTLNEWGVPVRLAILIDAYGKDTYIVPPNVASVANIYQRDHMFIKGAPAIYPADPSRTRILFNRQVSYKGRKLPMPEHSALKQLVLDEHAMVEYDPEIWNEVVRLITAAIAGPD